MEEFEFTAEKRMPVLPIRGISVFPGTMLTFDVERTASIGALGMAAKSGQLIFLAAQKSLTADMPQQEDIYQVGTVCRIRQQLRQPRGNVCRVMVEGLYRAKFLSVSLGNRFLRLTGTSTLTGFLKRLFLTFPA